MGAAAAAAAAAAGSSRFDFLYGFLGMRLCFVDVARTRGSGPDREGGPDGAYIESYLHIVSTLLFEIVCTCCMHTVEYTLQNVYRI